MRIISGTARRMLLTAPTGLHTRPTSDRAKEGLFNILGTQVRDARFLDIFCGSGAIGIEALSRGAGECVFIDNAKPAIDAVQRNLTAARLGDNAEIMHMNAKTALEKLALQGRAFDIIFLDPPYGASFDEILHLLVESALLSADGLLILEMDAKSPVPQIAGLTLARQRDYGRARFLFFTFGAHEEGTI
ncbi:MAG: 16S rRNA (guanine(966)-N(2))-methyltransferase RsmD [Defluviitaleaceae bacterium]|nr:16S rRNA (guanine(966)-N(2))-methyltransferase RsmD [Defluviitaleaceae bacterium]MCL2275046.1 16S rRNA (guanine(966)-N(2))-methyltransferase RsmD [Defluviitaleaceae bacterium]